MIEHNTQYPELINYLRKYCAEILINIENSLSTRMLPGKLMINTNLSIYLHATSHLGSCYSLVRQSKLTTTHDTWLVTWPICDSASHLQGDISHFDRHLPKLLKCIRNYSLMRIRKDKVTHGNSKLSASKNYAKWTGPIHPHSPMLRHLLHVCSLHTHLRHTLSNDERPDDERVRCYLDDLPIY